MITRPDHLTAFAASLSDMSPYSPSLLMDDAYIVSITRTDNSVILISLGKGHIENPDTVCIEFLFTSGCYSPGDYQSKKLYSFIESLHLEKWQNSEKTQD